MNSLLLSLAGSSLTDAGLKHVHSLAKLRELDLTGMKVSAAAVAALHQPQPKCKMVGAPVK